MFNETTGRVLAVEGERMELFGEKIFDIGNLLKTKKRAEISKLIDTIVGVEVEKKGSKKVVKIVLKTDEGDIVL